MQELTLWEINEVSGGGSLGQAVSTTAMITGGAIMGASMGGPLDALAGACLGAGGAYIYFHYAVAAK